MRTFTYFSYYTVSIPINTVQVVQSKNIKSRFVFTCVFRVHIITSNESLGIIGHGWSQARDTFFHESLTTKRKCFETGS